MYILCIVYVSEGIRPHIIERLSLSATSQKQQCALKLAHVFRDAFYNRTGFYLIGEKSGVVKSALALCTAAFDLLNFKNHRGTHPTLGIVDHVCFTPLQLVSGNQDLENTCIAETNMAADEFCDQLHEHKRVLVFKYGRISTCNLPLANIRRRLGYFENLLVTPSSDAIHGPASRLLNSFQSNEIIADIGTFNKMDTACQTTLLEKGITCVGSIPYIMNYNLRFHPNDSFTKVKEITKIVRSTEVSC